MLQQSQVKTVIPYFEKFMNRFPSVEALALSSAEEVLKHWAGLGYYSRARSLHAAAKKIWFERGGSFPRTREEWLGIPGVGPYTAGAILSIALDLPEPILDGNVERVLARLHCVSRKGGETLYKKTLWARSTEIIEKTIGSQHSPRVINQALMELGALICVPRNPLCNACPISAHCQARKKGLQSQFPEPRIKPSVLRKKETKTCLYDPSTDQYLLRQSQPGEWREGLWDFPSEEDLKTLLEKTRITEVVQLKSKHVVTRHQILRNTRVVILHQKRRKDFSEKIKGTIWVSRMGVADKPTGSAFRKTWIHCQEAVKVYFSEQKGN